MAAIMIFISLHPKDGTIQLKCPKHCSKFMQFFKPFKQVLLVRSIPTSKPVTSKLIHSQFHCKMAATQIRGASSLGFTVLWPFTYNFSEIFSIICLRPDLYWSWGTTIIWLPTNLFKNRFPSQPISLLCMKKKRSNESFNKFINFLRVLPSM